MMKYMLDTNFCIYVMNERPAAMKDIFNAKMGQMCISSITLAELYFDAERSHQKTQNHRQIEGFCKHLQVVSFDDAAAECYGPLRADLLKAGQSIGENDMLIASHAKSLGLTLVTNNESEFKRVKGLKVENWVK